MLVAFAHDRRAARGPPARRVHVEPRPRERPIAQSRDAPYREETGCAVVIVIHNLFQAKRLTDRVGLLLEGRLLEVGPVHEVFETPSRPETRASLSGEMAY
jgi:tungstate transport system ATP-binding protein